MVTFKKKLIIGALALFLNPIIAMEADYRSYLESLREQMRARTLININFGIDSAQKSFNSYQNDPRKILFLVNAANLLATASASFKFLYGAYESMNDEELGEDQAILNRLIKLKSEIQAAIARFIEQETESGALSAEYNELLDAQESLKDIPTI